MSMIVYPVLYNGVDLNSIAGVSVLATDPYRLPKRELSLTNLVRTNRSKVNSGYYNEKIITVKVAVQRSTRALLEQAIDQLNNILQPLDKELIFDQSGKQRLYYASLEDAIPGKDGGSYAEFDLKFKLTDRFGYDVTETTLLAVTTPYTSASRSDNLTFGGSGLTQAPIIRITFSAVTGATNKSVVIGNGSTGQQVTITRTWLGGDRIVIDPTSDTPVLVNNSPVTFDGAVPEWATGPGTWYINDNFTTRSWTGNIGCKFRYV